MEINKANKFTTIEYLMKNNLKITDGLLFTLNDYKYIKGGNYEEIDINHTKPTKEILNLQDIIKRICELYYLHKNRGNGEFHEDEILKIIEKRLEK